MDFLRHFWKLFLCQQWRFLEFRVPVFYTGTRAPAFSPHVSISRINLCRNPFVCVILSPFGTFDSQPPEAVIYRRQPLNLPGRSADCATVCPEHVFSLCTFFTSWGGTLFKFSLRSVPVGRLFIAPFGFVDVPVYAIWHFSHTSTERIPTKILVLAAGGGCGGESVMIIIIIIIFYNNFGSVRYRVRYDNMPSNII